MPRFTTPALLRALLLGSLGFAEQACSSSDGASSNDELDADAASGGQEADSGGNASGGDRTTGSGGQANATGGRPAAGGAPSSGGEATSDGGDAGSGGGESDDAGSGDDAGLVSVKGCTNPVPLLPGPYTGIYTCSEGYQHRAEARECGSRLPRDIEFTPPEGVVLLADECSRDSDCTATNSFCRLLDGTENSCGNAPRQYRRICEQGCRVDADCGAASVCVCGADIGVCVAVNDAAGCHSDADCEDGLCLSNANLGPFGPATFACQLPSDECDSRADCEPTLGYCSMSPTGRTCQQAPACGRPFLVERAPRLAGVVRSDAWLGVEEVGGVDVPQDAEVARRLADHWTQIGLMEHASIAAFARFTLQLLSLGAPAQLVRDSTQAQADETRHAAIAFQLAAAYGARPVAPGPLDLRGALDTVSLEEILRTTIAEGCVGETRAALEAAEAARAATVPGVRRILQRISADESAHAALAWRVVQWILAEHPELAPVAEAELARASISPAGGAVPTEPQAALLLAHGLLDARTLSRVHRSAEREVVAPCARALVAALA